MQCEIGRMEINYTFYFFAFFEKVIKKLLTFCYWEYDEIFNLLNKKSSETGETQFTEEENQQFKEMLNSVINYNITLEIIGTWIWAFDSYEYRKELKELGFTYAPKKKAWTWHYGEYKRHYKKEIPIDDIRAKYGTETVRGKIR